MFLISVKSVYLMFLGAVNIYIEYSIFFLLALPTVVMTMNEDCLLVFRVYFHRLSINICRT
jgi:hypothetical protein